MTNDRPLKTNSSPEAKSDSSGRDPSQLLDLLLKESYTMAEYAVSSGLQIPPSVTVLLGTSAKSLDAYDSSNESDRRNLAKELTRVHGNLARIVAPARPGTLQLFEDQKAKTGFARLGAVPLIRWMIIAALISLISFLVLSILRDVYALTLLSDRLSENLILLAAAGMGASYLALYQANRFIVEGTFNPKHNNSYWIRFVLGLTAGVILAQVISEATGTLEDLGKTMLALLGGFSAAVVYRILTRLVEAVESIFRGDQREIIAAQEEATKARLGEQNTEERIEMAADLRSLSQQMTPEGVDDARRKVNEILDKLLPFGSELSEGE